ncbi:MAG TPA: glycerophosphodiester phosphodiesterase family protein [Candidatus Saccharimonadales bacterium]|nr:glycerophosphodiester phosphodiesterase family protein [Candidatus Saccharimonadales bacterium]
MKIISHRGAAGLAPENTILGIKIAGQYEVEYIEVDAQATRDRHLVLSHDEYFRTKAGTQIKIEDSTLKDIRDKSGADHKIPTLEEAFKAAGRTPLLIDCKGKDWESALAKSLNKFKGPRPIVACDDSHKLFAFSQAVPDIDCYLSELTRPFETVQAARALGFAGVCLLYSIYNPLVYFAGKRSGLKMTMYTVNRPVYAWFLHFFYPEVMLTTDFPDRFTPKKRKLTINRKRRKKSKKK